MTEAIQHVSDTALWVAYYRALESSKPDALFNDPYALMLSGEKGKNLAEALSRTRKYTAWTVAIRTYLLDHWLSELLATRSIKTVINVGAGMDTRPYRIDCNPDLHWIELDESHLLDRKQISLHNAQPKCKLVRMSIDVNEPQSLANAIRSMRLDDPTLVLSEGVLPYLTEASVAALAHTLSSFNQIRYWITEYISPRIYKYLRSTARTREMAAAPFQFFPGDWYQFFSQLGWKSTETRFLGDQAKALNRSMPAPWWAKPIKWLLSPQQKQSINQAMGYTLLTPTIVR